MRACMNMEASKNDTPKLPDMVMCGDHPSFTKTELNVKTDTKVDDTDKEKGKQKTLSYSNVSPSGSRAEPRATSEHALRLSEARRRARSLEVVQRPDVDVQANGNRALVQAALGSFRWPPYLLCVWVLVLVLTHVLHCLVSLLERALPALRKCTLFFRTWTEASWRSAEHSSRMLPAGLGLLTGLLYALYFALYAAYAVVLWAIEPLCGDEPRLDAEQKVTNYDDDFNTADCYKP